jgi:hypothetical protein
MIKEDSCSYQWMRVFTAIRQLQVSRPHGWRVPMKQLGHKLVDPFLGQSYTRQRECQIGVIISPAFKRQGGKLTISRFAAGVGHRQALIGAFVPTSKGLNSPKMEFFDAVARLKPGPVELSYALDQGGQTYIHRWLYPFFLDDQREEKLVIT